MDNREELKDVEKMSDDNYKLLSDKLDSFRKDVDNRLDVMKDKMVARDVLLASVIVPLIGVNLAFLGPCVAAIINMWAK